MNHPAVEPDRARADVRYLWPDLHRPGLALRLAGEPPEGTDPAAVCERIERELADLAWRYRRVLVSGIFALVMPALWLAVAWWASWNLPPGLWFDPFIRGWYFPGPSYFEAVAVALLFTFLLWGQMTGPANLRSLRRLGADYRGLIEADEVQRAGIVAETATGRWPRVEALLRQGREFGAYRPSTSSDDGARSR